MEFEELSKEKAEKIKIAIKGIPNSVPGSDWLSVYPFNPSDVFDNPNLLGKTVAAGLVLSGAALLGSAAALYSLDLVRVDENIYDTDRHRLSFSGSVLLKRKEIDKNFPEHHSEKVPHYYDLK